MNNGKFDRKQRKWYSVDQSTIQELASTGRHQECLQTCQQLLQSEPESPVAWKYAGKSLLALGQFEKAQQCLEKAHQFDNKDPETTVAIGNIFLNLGRTEDATEWYKRTLQINNNYAPAINNIANIKRQSGNNQEASNLFKQAIQADPQLVQAYVGAAASSLTLGDLDKAELFATQAIEINAGAPGIHEILGIIFQTKNNAQQAVESYKKELAINPQSNISLLNLGLLLLKQGQAAEAIEPLEREAAINPSRQCSLLLAQAYQKIGKLKEAIIEYRKIDIIQSQNKMIPFNLGLCLLNTGSNIEAIEAFKSAIKLDESFLPAWGNIGKALMNEGRYDEALLATQKVLELDPDNPSAHMNLGGIYKELGNLDQALSSTLKSLELKPDNPDAHMNLGSIYKNLGNLDQAVASILKSIELNPDNPDALMNLGGIYQTLGNLDQALACTLKSHELKPEGSQALCKLGRIKMSLGQAKEARKDLLTAIKNNDQDYEAYYTLSLMLETTKDAEEIIDLMRPIKTSVLTPYQRVFADFALSNCFHRIKKYEIASKHLQSANKYKLKILPSEAESILQGMAISTSHFKAAAITDIDRNIGESRIFIVGMPRSGSTLLATILCMNPEIKDLGESRSLAKAITNFVQQNKDRIIHQNLNDLYAQMEPSESKKYKYTVDKQLYNFMNLDWITTYMPAAKIIHCRRNPMDNILSMHRSNLITGNNYTGNLEDIAKVLVAQEQAVQVQKNRYPEKIFTFNYEQFVNAPEVNLRKLLGWLDLDFDNNYLHPEKSTKTVITASVMQARKPISNKSVGGWKKYENLLKPAMNIIQESGIEIE